MWFVVHVRPGTEIQAVELLKAAPKSDGLDEVFCPMAVYRYQKDGENLELIKPVFDGCVFVVAPSKWELRACMKRADGIEAICDKRPAYDALEDGEEVFIDQITEPEERIVPASEAVVDKNGRLTVQTGPLHGRENEIRKHSERRRWAYLNTCIAGETANARLGLRVTRNDSLHPWER